MFQLQELDLIKAAVDKLDHWEIVMPSATDDDELQFELTPTTRPASGSGRMVMVPTVPRITSATSWMTWMPSKVRTTNWLTPSVRL